MKKFVCGVLGLCMVASALTGCGTTLEGESSIIYVEKSGSVISLDVESLEQDYYDEEELATYVEDEVDKYTQTNGSGSVKVDSLNVENGTARLQMTYETTQDYMNFNGIELYQGTVLESLAAGYVFDSEFAKVADGQVTGMATKQEIYEEQNLQVVVIRANMDVQVEGEICYVSCDNVKLTGADSVSIREGYYLDNGAQESVSGTEQIESTESAVESEDVVEDGSFETEVYTFIVYK